jgi:colanic acid biosynthesis glycosyl transferase WcaI
VNILIVSQYFWPENFRINDLAQEWTGRGHSVTVLTGVPNYPAGSVFPEYQKNPKSFSSYMGAEVIRVPLSPRGQGVLRLVLNYLSFVFSASSWGAWKLRQRKFDVIFVFEPSPVTVGLPAIWLGWLKKSPVVFWALDLWPETLAAIGVVRSPAALRLVGRLVSFIYNRCTLVLGQSRAFVKSIAQYCRDESKIVYFPSWAEDVYAEAGVKPAPEIEPRQDCFNVMFAGNMGEAQDLSVVLDAAEQLGLNSKVRWLLVGDGRKSDWLAMEVERRNLVDQVILLGRFPVERMPSFYAHADALLVSLKKDDLFAMTIPGKVQSYLQSGKPILGVLDGEGAKVINEAQAGLTCGAGNSSALAQMVLQIASMTPENRLKMGRNGVEYAQREFDRRRLMDKLEDLLAQAVKRYPNNQRSLKK